MIKVHRLNGQEIIINSDLIETIESHPDTVISLYTGNKYLIKESVETVNQQIIEYKKKPPNPPPR
jgi:flagellar protein FlbD